MRDQFDLAVSCNSPQAVRAYDRAVDASVRGWPGVPEAIQEALDAAPDFALPHVLRAMLLAGRGQGAAARESIAIARSMPNTLTRERSQIELVATMIEGRTRDALALLIEHAREFPTDLLAMSTGLGAYGLFAFSGRADHDAARLAFVDALAAHYPTDYPWLLAHRGWARIECGRVEEGLDMARRAIALRPQNAHNAHIVMHGYFETNEPQAALQFIDEWLAGYPDTALMWGHLQWHAALAHLELGQVDAAAQILTGPIVEYLPRGLPFMGLADMASLLWRLGLLGAPHLPWHVAHQHARQHYPKGSNPFGELHLAMLAAAHRDREALSATHQRLQSLAQGGHDGAPAAMHWAQALGDLLDGKIEVARDRLETCRLESVRLGGSHAQRSVIEQTLAALRIPSAG